MAFIDRISRRDGDFPQDPALASPDLVLHFHRLHDQHDVVGPHWGAHFGVHADDRALHLSAQALGAVRQSVRARRGARRSRSALTVREHRQGVARIDLRACHAALRRGAWLAREETSFPALPGYQFFHVLVDELRVYLPGANVSVRQQRLEEGNIRVDSDDSEVAQCSCRAAHRSFETTLCGIADDLRQQRVEV